MVCRAWLTLSIKVGCWVRYAAPQSRLLGEVRRFLTEGPQPVVGRGMEVLDRGVSEKVGTTHTLTFLVTRPTDPHLMEMAALGLGTRLRDRGYVPPPSRAAT